MSDNWWFYHPVSNGHSNESGLTAEVSGGLSSYDWVLFLVNATIMVVSLVGNICVIYFICGQKKARTTPNITIVSIAVADILTSSFVVPTYFAITKHHMAGDTITPFLCKLNVYIWYWCKTVTIYSIVAMVCDRYNRFNKPFKANSNMSGRFMFFLSFVWFFGAAYNIWEIVLNSSVRILVEAPDKSANMTVRMCGPSRQFRYLHDGFLAVDFIVIFILPFIVVAYFFSSISHHILHPDERVSRQRISGKRRLAMSAILFSLFYMCQLPFEILDAISYFSSTFPSKFTSLTKLLETISFSQGFLNVVAYASCSIELHHTIRKRYHRRRTVRGTSPPLVPSSLQIPEIRLTNDTSEDITAAADAQRD